MKGSLYIGAVRGIKMYIHWTFSLLLIWIIGSHLNEGGEFASIGNKVIFIFAVFACVLLHELGHALSALRYGIKTHDITLLPIGGVARLERIPENPLQELVVAAAGPAVNVFIALIIYLFLLLKGGIPDEIDPATISESDLALNLLIVNISLVLFNLIPAFPMDGGRMLRAFLGMRLSRERATRYAAALGQILAVGFMIFGFYYNPVLMFIGLFIFMGARQEAAHVKRSEMLKEVKVREIMLTDFRVVKADDTIRSAIDLLLSTAQHDFLAVDYEGKVKGLLTRDNLLRGIAAYGIDSAIEPLLIPALEGVSPEQPAMKVYQQMMETESAAVPVTEGNRLSGMLTSGNIREFFLVKHAVELHKN